MAERNILYKDEIKKFFGLKLSDKGNWRSQELKANGTVVLGGAIAIKIFASLCDIALNTKISDELNVLTGVAAAVGIFNLAVGNIMQQFTIKDYTIVSDPSESSR